MEKDVSRLAVERVVTRISAVREKMKSRMPYGPNQVKLTPREARRFIQDMDSGVRERMRSRVGEEEWQAMLRRLYAA